MNESDKVISLFCGILLGVCLTIGVKIGMDLLGDETTIPKYKVGTYFKVTSGFYTSCKGILDGLSYTSRGEPTNYYGKALCPGYERAQLIVVAENEIEVLNVK